ncbi:MAG: hypothetical protein SFV54_09285 [Bryobacteraceae bacterium]|nr:hypothetical protein [Bryobacteraceae bacterium]
MSTTRLQEVLICFGKQKQTDIAAANTSGQMWQLRKLNAALANPKLNTENDAEEFGKGHEFPTQSFQTSWDVNGTLEKYLGAEIGAWAMAYGLGKVVKSGTNPNFTYTCTPLIPANGDAAELPYFSFVEQIRPGAGVVVDRMAVGCVVEGWTIAIGSGPGRANSKITVEFVGSGKAAEPSGITMPAATLEKLLPSASLALTINGVNYVSNKNIVSLETSWKNNVRLDSGFYPGSGFQSPGDATSGAIRGRLEFANRQGTLKFVARFENGSTELTKLKNQSTGTAVISLTYDSNNSLDITWQKVSFAMAEVGETDGIVTVSVECLPMYDSTNGIVSAVSKCTVDNICQ